MTAPKPVAPSASASFGSIHFVTDANGRSGAWEWSPGGGGSWMRKTRGAVTFVKPDAAALLGWRYAGPCAH